MTLEEKIQNRETELQIAYDLAIGDKNELEFDIYQMKMKLQEVKKRISDIEIRAIELGVLHVLKT